MVMWSISSSYFIGKVVLSFLHLLIYRIWLTLNSKLYEEDVLEKCLLEHGPAMLRRPGSGPYCEDKVEIAIAQEKFALQRCRHGYCQSKQKRDRPQRPWIIYHRISASDCWDDLKNLALIEAYKFCFFYFYSRCRSSWLVYKLINNICTCSCT